MISCKLSLLEERLASHLLGLGQAHGREDGGGDVTQDTLVVLEAPALGVVGHDEGHLVGGVAGLGLAVGELHLLGVAVVSGDEENVALLLAGLEDLANGLVGGLAADDGGLVDTSVANHVGRSKVVHDKGELLLTQTLDDLVGNASGRHLGGVVVGGDRLVGGDEILGLVAGLEGKDLFNAAVEEEGDVSVLLSLGNVNLLDTLLAQPLGEHVAHALGLKGDLEGVVALVLGHGDEGLDLGVFKVGEDRSVDIAEKLRDLTDTVGSVVEEEDGIVVCYLLGEAHLLCHRVLTLDAALITTNNDGGQELIPVLITTTLISSSDGSDGVLRGLTLAVAQTLEGNLDSLPALVTVHGKVSADDGGDLTNLELLHGFDKLLHVVGARLGVGVTAITKEVDEDLGDVVLLGGLEEGVEVCLLGVLQAV